MTNFRKAFPSKFLKAEDVTKPSAVEIKSVDFEDIGTGQRQEQKLVAYFVNVPKGLVLNRINSETIAEICGSDEYEQWPGHTITLFPTKTEFQGKRVPCIRISEPPRATQSTRPPATTAERVPGWVTEPDQATPDQAGRARDIDEAMPNTPLGEPVL